MRKPAALAACLVLPFWACHGDDPPKPCVGQLDCGAFQVCLNKFCAGLGKGGARLGQGCSRDADCGAGLSCLGTAQGAPAGECTLGCNASSCPGGSVCTDLRATSAASLICSPACSRDSDCRSGYSCCKALGSACVPAAMCGPGAVGPGPTCAPPGNPNIAPSALTGAPQTAPPPGACDKTVRNASPPAQLAQIASGAGPYRVSTQVSFNFPPGMGSFSIVSQAVSAPDTVTFQSKTIPNSVVPTLVKRPDGSLVYDDNVDPPPDPSDQTAYYGTASPSTGAFTLPNATPLLLRTSVGALPAGTWSFTVNDFGLECVGDPRCGTSGTNTSTYDVKVVLKPIALGTGTIDVGFYLIGGGSLSAATAATDPRVQRMIESLRTLLGGAGLCLGNVLFFDVPAWAKTRYAVLNIDQTSSASTGTLPCSDLDQMFTLSQYAPPGLRLNFFLVDAITATSNTGQQRTVGIDGTIPGPSGFDGTVHSGAAVSVADIFAGACASPGLDLRGCGADVVAYIAAHEAGHYLGLYHTTESNGEFFDPLTDTPTCACESCAPKDSQAQCATPGKTPLPSVPTQVKSGDCMKTGATCGGADNLMFWILDGNFSRGTLSSQQGQVIRANPLVQ